MTGKMISYQNSVLSSLAECQAMLCVQSIKGHSVSGDSSFSFDCTYSVRWCLNILTYQILSWLGQRNLVLYFEHVPVECLQALSMLILVTFSQTCISTCIALVIIYLWCKYFWSFRPYVVDVVRHCRQCFPRGFCCEREKHWLGRCWSRWCYTT